MPKEKGTILGWYGHNNAGDESYKLTISKLLQNNSLIFTDKIIENTDFYVLGGGNVIDEFFTDQLKDIKNKYAISVSLTKPHLLKDFKKILVRDKHSLELLQNNNIDCQLIPDLAFLLKPNKYDIKNLFHDKELYEKLVVIVINSHLLPPSDEFLAKDFVTFNYVIERIAKIIDNTSASFLFVPFGQQEPYDDRVTNSILGQRCKYWKKNVILYEPVSPQNLLNIISCANVVISTRLHASIFSCVGGVPFIDLTHHSKNYNFLETIDKVKWSIPYWHFDQEKFKDLLNHLLNHNYSEELNLLSKTKREELCTLPMININ